MPSESDIISRLKNLGRAGSGVVVGIGDDAAVIKATTGKDLVACCDLMVEGVHFQTEWASPRLLGRKALAVTLSDVAAMGAVPRFAMISIALPPRFSSEFINDLFDGLFELGASTGTTIIGGDTSASPSSLFIDVSIVGECASEKAVTRAGAGVGDSIFVSGSLGASALGLSLLEEGFRLVDSEPDDPRTKAASKHLIPQPQLNLGRAIGERGLASAMIDISDGLSTDMWHILEESACGAVINAKSIPIAESVQSLSELPGIDPLRLAINGGEEYELLFTSPPEKQSQVAALSDSLGISITNIGRIVAGRTLQLDHGGAIEMLKPMGYQHLI